MENQNRDAPPSPPRRSSESNPARSSPALPLETPIRPPQPPEVSSSSAAQTSSVSDDPHDSTSEDDEENEKQHRQQPSAPSSYLLTWTDTEMSRTRLTSASQLSALITSDGASKSHLFVLHGLPVDFLQVLRDQVGVDDRFLAAHVGRRVNGNARFARKSRMKTGDDYAHFDYPELVRPSDATPIRARGEREKTGKEWTPPDLVGEPPAHLISEDGDAVVLCRASTWLCDKARILFLDRPTWASPSSGVARGRYKTNAVQSIPDENGISSLTVTYDADGNAVALGDEIPSLETLLYENLRDQWYDCGDLGDFLEDMIIHQWTQFFEEEFGGIDDDPTQACTSSTGQSLFGLYWRTQNCLERNLDVARQRDRTKALRRALRPDTVPGSKLGIVSTTVPEWEALVERMGRRVQMLRLLGGQQQNGNGNGSGGDGGGDNPNFYNNATDSSSSSDEHQRSLDRVTYLGGVALPFTVVSGILSMSDPFNAGGSMFYVFWVVTIPIILITLLVIYADKLRNVEVWIEEQASEGADADGQEGGSSTAVGNGDEKLPNGNRPGSRRHNVKKPGTPTTPQLEQGIPYSYSEPMPELVHGGTSNSPGTATPGNRVAEAMSLPLPEEDDYSDYGDEPDTFVERRWRPGSRKTGASGGKTKWQKEQLGWMGACATLFNVYKLKKGAPPGWSPPSGTRRGPGGPGTLGRAPRRVRTG
ncbi:hypothetical protein F5Y16DRAFT_116254 [Xylariaceae sp. FL0255]|nr:hypothetical protein F5Y16DRAFT_116254 [Xylariaceae sp. FL0255]